MPATRPRIPDASLDSLRGQSETIGLILVFGMVLFGALLIVSFGSAAIEETQSGLSDQRAEKAMTQFDSKSALVALGNANSQAVDFPLRGAESLNVDESAGEMTITVEKLSGTVVQQNTWTLGALTFETDDKALAYQGGGVWRRNKESNESVMVSPPEFHFRNGTLTLPVITIKGEGKVGQRANVNHTGTDSWYPSPSAGRMNPLDDHTVFVTVRSEYYKGWGRYFEERTDGKVTYDHPNNEVTIQLVTPIGTQKVKNAAASLSASGSFILQGSRHTTCDGPDGEKTYANSYNSSEPGDCTTQQNLGSGVDNHNGDIVYGDDIDITTGAGNSDIYGDLRGGDEVTVQTGGGKPEIYGNISYNNDCIPDDTGCEGRIKDLSKFSLKRNSGIESIGAIDFHIRQTVNRIADDPDTDNDINDGATPPELTLTGDNTLGNGEYYVRSIDIPDSDRLEIDTSGGPVTIAVEEDVLIGEDATLEVTGPNVVKIYVNQTAPGMEFQMDKKAVVETPGQDATQLRVYGKAAFNAEVGGGQGGNLATFMGVLYAPPGAAGTGTVDIHGGEVYGAVLTGTTTITGSGGGSIHFDNALQHENVIQPGAKIVKITYLHVSENTVTVSG